MPSAWPAWLVMWTLAGGVYGACKLLTWRAADDAGHRATSWRHAGYLLAWPGMDAPAFFANTAVRQPALREWCAAAGRTALGAGLIFAVVPAAGAGRSVVTGWLGMLGLVLLLHFGAFHLLSCAWRFAGVDARPLMASPLRSASVAEFWGRRWNTAFRDLTHRFVFTPLRRWLGPAAAILAGFIGSGLVHDLVISLPARGGYGGPTGFFAVQGVALLVERSDAGRRLGLGRGIRGRVFTAAVLLLPLPWLFHRAFVERVVVPFLQVLGAA
jgi:hypothetical protein